jgi:transposase InsO family protein
VVIYCFTKLARYYAVTSKMTVPQLADLFARKLVLLGAGFPNSIVTDQGTQLTSKFWATLCHHLRIERRLNTSYNPQTDGQTEQQNRTLEQYLRAYVNYCQNNWVY